MDKFEQWVIIHFTMFEKNTLTHLIDLISYKALKSGALMPINTHCEYVNDSGINFVVRVVSNLIKKDEDRLKKAQDKTVNPFLPYDRELFVTDLTSTHLVLLNKFNVIDRHLLIVTKAFKHQEELLTINDFEALWMCMSEYDSLGFYNGGEAAGASQSHKHLQVVPLPLSDNGLAVPIQPLCDEVHEIGQITKLSMFNFAHCFAKLHLDNHTLLPINPAQQCYNVYCSMLQSLSMSVPKENQDIKQSLPYCLLISRQWVLLVPRSQEFFEGISINSLGFAGCLLVRNQNQLEIIKRLGAFKLLQSVAIQA